MSLIIKRSDPKRSRSCPPSRRRRREDRGRRHDHRTSRHRGRTTSRRHEEDERAGPDLAADDDSLADRIVTALARHGGRTLTLDDLLARGHFRTGERRAVGAALADLARRGTVIEVSAQQYALTARQHLRAGEVQVHPDGYAFLVDDERGVEPGVAAPRRRAGEHQKGERRGRISDETRRDLYISGAGLRPAMHGDRVLASVVRRRHGTLERSEGRVVQVLERRTTRLAGVVRQGRAGTYLVPQEPRVTYRIALEDAGGARDGDLAIAVITHYPGPYEDITARVETVLGPASDPRVESDAIVYKHELPRAFPPAVEREAARVATAVPRDCGAGVLPEPPHGPRPWHQSPALATRVDLRAVPFVTIDGENARDFDDAVAIIDGPQGGVRLLVAIADVAAYVARGSALDREARARGTSVYFPDRVIPMLPEALSNDVCSLVPDVDRLVQAVLLDCDHRGAVIGAAFLPGLIRSRARLTYTTVREIVADRELATRRRWAALVEDLERMAALAEQMTRRRQARGSIDFDLPEAEIVLDLRGRPENVVKAERNVAHRLIESFMLAANEAVARYLTAVRVPMPYRIHEPPDEDAVRDLGRFLEGFGIRLASIEGEVRPATFQHALARVAGRPEERLVNTVLLRAMKQARYAPLNAGHFGLAAEHYTHFTSPIRRYPDLVLHRILAAHVRHDRREIATIDAELAAICEESSRRERVSMEAEREVAQLRKVQFMQDKVGETFDGFISGVAPFGLFVELERYFVEGLVHVATLTDDRYEFIERQHLLEGRRRRRVFRLGDPVRVRVASVSIERLQVDLVLADDGLTPDTRRPR